MIETNGFALVRRDDTYDYFERMSAADRKQGKA